jgi:hypothetical protein
MGGHHFSVRSFPISHALPRAMEPRPKVNIVELEEEAGVAAEEEAGSSR